MRHPSLDSTQHRPWPLPASPWVAAQSWRHLLFAHWRVDAASLRPHIPDELEIEEADGTAWIAVVPFYLVIRPRFAPSIPRVAMFPEINVRTYVSHSGKPGVWFFSLDATSPLAVWAARRFVHLPYQHASIELHRQGPSLRCTSRRRSPEAPLELDVSYGPTKQVTPAAPQPLEHFLTERYCLYAQAPDGRLFRTEVHHAPWPLQPATATIEANTLLTPVGMPNPGPPEWLHFAERIDVTTWMPQRIA